MAFASVVVHDNTGTVRVLLVFWCQNTDPSVTTYQIGIKIVQRTSKHHMHVKQLQMNIFSCGTLIK
jgi:hypothetical protein